MPTPQSLPRFFFLLVLAVGLAACDSADDDDGGGNGNDSAPPVLVSATFSGSTVTANFNEALDPQSVTPSAFSITPSVAISSASASGTQAFLTTATELDDDVTYTLTVSGVGDTSGNVSATSTTPITESGGTGGGGGGGTTAAQEIGAAYPNAGDARVVLFNTDGDRFLLFNPATGTASDADDLNDVENGLIPIDNVGAAASFSGENETYFFSTDGDTFTNYERENAEFDAPASFEEEYDEFGYELTSIGAAVEGDFFASNSMILFNGNGTQWQLWQPTAGSGGTDVFSDVFFFPSGFGNNSPISAVGAAFFDAGGNRIFFFNREGTQYTIWTGDNNFTTAFDISELGDIEF